jgi:Fibronectin type III domain.
LHSYEGAATSHTLDSLAHETTYSWRVRATNDAGDGQWSESWSFTTKAAPITPVSQVVLSTPADGATDQDLTPSLSWQADVEASGYRLEVSTDDFATALHSYEGAATSFTLDSLAYETTYSWRVRATNDAGDGQWSESWSFTTKAEPITPVSQVVLSAPADGATDQALTPSLSWQADVEATGYRLEVSTDDFATALHSYEGAATSYTLDSLAYETTYSWRVRATNEAGDGQWSESWSFTTQAAPDSGGSDGDSDNNDDGDSEIMVIQEEETIHAMVGQMVLVVLLVVTAMTTMTTNLRWR